MKYRVLLRGQNFRISLNGKMERLGFYTTRFVEAADREEAELRAVQIVREDKELEGCVNDDRKESPMIYLEEIVEVNRFPENGGDGFTFFQESEKQ